MLRAEDQFGFIFDGNRSLSDLCNFGDSAKQRWSKELRGEENQPKGSGQLMCRMALDEVFSRYPEGLVLAEVLKSNPRSFDFHLKLGFEPVPATESKQSRTIWSASSLGEKMA